MPIRISAKPPANSAMTHGLTDAAIFDFRNLYVNIKNYSHWGGESLSASNCIDCRKIEPSRHEAPALTTSPAININS